MKKTLSIKEYVEQMLERMNLENTINKEAELWNILYNLLENYGYQCHEELDREDSEIMGFLDTYEAMYSNYFPKGVNA